MKAQRIEVIRSGWFARVLVDGEELPAQIPRSTDITVGINPDEAPTVRVTLQAERVDVRDVLRPDEDE